MQGLVFIFGWEWVWRRGAERDAQLIVVMVSCDELNIWESVEKKNLKKYFPMVTVTISTLDCG